MAESRGIIMFNRGPKMLINALVALYSLRKHYQGPITFYVEDPTPSEFDQAIKNFDCNVVRLDTKHEMKTLVRKSSLFENPPYDLTLWMDLDTVTIGSVDKMFDYLIEKDVDIVFPSFCNWISSGHHISARINRFKGLVDEKYIKEALNKHPSVNTGVLSFRKSDKLIKFMRDVTDLAQKGGERGIFIPDECSMAIYYPSMHEWGLKCYICETDYNVSPLHDHGLSKDPKICHFHGSKSTLDEPLCEHFKSAFKEMCDSNIAGINSFLKYADKRLGQYLRKKDGLEQDVTIVTAIDTYYVDILRVVLPNWIKYKRVDKFPMIVFYNGMEASDPRLDFLRLPNIRLIPWNESCMDKVDSHRELMLSSFVLGSAQYVETDYWLKLDSDSIATDDRIFVTDAMKQYSIFSHRWGYSRPQHIKQMDAWAKTCTHRKIRSSRPMIEQGRIEGNRFYHNGKRFISYICLQKTRYTRYCVSLLKEKRLPCPSQDTFAYYLIQRLKPEAMGIGNFKRDYGFTQLRGKMGADHIRQCVEQVDKNISSKVDEQYGIENEVGESP